MNIRLNGIHGCRYSLLVHHTPEELRTFGLTEPMLIDQEWYPTYLFILSFCPIFTLSSWAADCFIHRQMVAKPGELNYNWLTAGPSFFTRGWGWQYYYDPYLISDHSSSISFCLHLIIFHVRRNLKLLKLT